MITTFVIVNVLAIGIFGIVPLLNTRRELPDFLRNQSGGIIEAAHRGYSAEAPENTIASIKVAADKRVQIVETDLLLTSDNVVVVSHDYTLDGFTNATGSIIDLKWEDIRYSQVRDGQ
jgi:glycerophosphoryl diester phosphodiesterase